jgi:hypothetical protein
MERICCKIERINQMGVELRVIDIDTAKPRGCPGLGGWKSGEHGWWTRVKGQKAMRDFGNLGVGSYVDITLDGDNIVSIQT